MDFAAAEGYVAVLRAVEGDVFAGVLAPQRHFFARIDDRETRVARAAGEVVDTGVLDRAVDADEILVDDPPRAEVRVSDLGVPHLAGGQHGPRPSNDSRPRVRPLPGRVPRPVAAVAVGAGRGGPPGNGAGGRCASRHSSRAADTLLAQLLLFGFGHREILLCEAILRSHRQRGWVDVPEVST